MNQHGDLIKWLNKAYTLEVQIVDILKQHADDANEHLEVKDKILEHLELTKKHADKIKKCVKELGGEVRLPKQNSLQSMLNPESSLQDIVGMKVIENAAKEFSIENYELALYSVIHRYAEELDEEEVMDTVESIMDDEIEMADWLDINLSELVDKVINEGIDENELFDEDID